MSTPYIRFKNVNYSIKKREILKGLNLDIERGEFVALVGENGSGKTTLSKLLLGILKRDSGEILVDGRDAEKYKLHEMGLKIGYVFQNPSHQIFAPTIEEELSFAMKYKGIDADIITEKTNDMIELFSLGDAQEVSTYNLSQGEKQRLAIACMILNEPEFIVLDEPTVGLDIERKTQLMEHLKNINEQGIGILIISHDKDFIKNYADRMICMKDGIIHEVE